MSTQKREDLKNQLAKNVNGGGAVQEKPKTPEQLVGQYLAKNQKAIESVLPQHMDKDRLARLAFNVIRTNPLLLQSSMPSLMGAVLESAKLGLEPGVMGQSYIIPFKNFKASKAEGRDVYEAQFIIGYRGMIDLVRRSGQIENLEARAVHENDDFEFEYGINSTLTHKPALSNKGATIAYYAVAHFRGGGYSFQVMSREDIEAHRDKYSRSKNYGPWVDEFDAMAKKTVLRQLVKYLPISVEFLNHDERSGVAIHNEIADEENVIDVDQETGEIIGGGNN